MKKEKKNKFTKTEYKKFGRAGGLISVGVKRERYSQKNKKNVTDI